MFFKFAYHILKILQLKDEHDKRADQRIDALLKSLNYTVITPLGKI